MTRDQADRGPAGIGQYDGYAVDSRRQPPVHDDQLDLMRDRRKPDQQDQPSNQRKENE